MAAVPRPRPHPRRSRRAVANSFWRQRFRAAAEIEFRLSCNQPSAIRPVLLGTLRCSQQKIKEKPQKGPAMIKSSVVSAAALACLAMVAPGMVQSSFAGGSAYYQKQRDEAYKAFSENGMASSGQVRGAVTAPSRTFVPPSATAGSVDQPVATPREPMYPLPRGGREY